MSTHEISLIAIDIRKWDLETQKLALTSYFVIHNEERSAQFEISLLQPTDMVEEFLGKLKYQVAKSLFENEESAPEIEIESESFLRQKLYSYFRKILGELNNPRRKKGQPKMIYTTHMDVYNENQDISFLPKDIQFFVVLNWARRYYEREDYQKAIEPLKRLLKLNPEFGLGYKWLARSLKKIRKFEEAMRMYEKYAEVDGSLDSWLDLAKSYRKGKLFDKSEKIYHDILEKYPNDKEARIGLAQIKYARKEPDYIEILDALHEEDPEWLKEWLTEEFNFRIYVPEKTMLSPLQAAKFLGYDKVLDLTQKAFKNEVPSHFNPAKARLTFYKEELENWAFVMNRYNTLGEEVKLYPEALATMNMAANAKSENGQQEEQSENSSTTEESGEAKPRKLTRVEEILMKIRARREELGLPEPQKRKRGRPRKTPVEDTSTATETTAAASAGENNETTEEQPVKRRRGRPRKSETASVAEAPTMEATATSSEEEAVEQPKRRRGRPRKSETQPTEAATTPAEESTEQPVKRRRGRPRKTETAAVAEAPTTEAAATPAKEEVTEQPKRRRGRPRKSEIQAAEATPTTTESSEEQPPKRRRGRPRKTETPEPETPAVAETAAETEEPPKRRRGRPRKTETTATGETASNNGESDEQPKRRRGRPPKSETASDSSNGKPESLELPEMPDTTVVED